MLGYRFADSQQYSTPRTNKIGPPLLWSVKCLGNPTNLLDCNSDGWYNVPTQCLTHSQDFYVRCESMLESS